VGLVTELADELVTRLTPRLERDSSRVLARLFVPGHEQLDEESRATGVLARILALDDAEVSSALRRVRSRYGGRHRDLDALLLAHARLLDHRIPDGSDIGPERRSLLGAYFTQELALEGAALFNPSVVAHPDQSGCGPAELRFVLSLRAVGEGHISCVEFRTGTWAADGTVRIDPPGPYVESGVTGPTVQQRQLFGARLEGAGADAESTRYLLSRLPEAFTDDDLERGLSALRGQRLTRQGAEHTAELSRALRADAYEVTFPVTTGLAERVLYPHAPAESHGIEDARFVSFSNDDGTVELRATYTAFDGQRIQTHLVTTTDFRTFRFCALAGPGAQNKGLALFPRKVGGRQLALSRWDRESCSVTSSADGLCWEEAVTVHVPRQPWEVIQSGNCGAPIETAAGWLVLTHGVGPMREYALGALLLDLSDPTRVVGSLDEPFLVPDSDERVGYVPNVLYSCGALRHGDRLLLPYGASDVSVRFASIDLPALLERLVATRVKSSA
jgi:predicted GH43/DUF377 family glycosyl hydrolase